MTKGRILFIGSLLCALFVVILGTNTWLYGQPQLYATQSVKTDQPTVDPIGSAQRLGKAIQFATISNDVGTSTEPFLKFHEFLEMAFPLIHANLERKVVNDHSLLYTWKGTDTTLKPILLIAHMDVVPVERGTEKDWDQPPFSGSIEGGFVWGRGALDMKASLMAILEAVEWVLANGKQPKRTLYLAFGHDEEIGGGAGAAIIGNLLRARGVQLAFTLDEGLVVTEGILPGIKRPVAVIGVAEKGLVTLQLKARGPGGHGSVPPSGSAISRLSEALARIEKHPLPADLRPPVTAMFEAIGADMQFSTRFALANQWLFRPLINAQLSRNTATNALIRSTMGVTIVNAGVKKNVIPQEAEAFINVRMLPGDTVSTIIQHLMRVIDDEHVKVVVAEGTNLPASPISESDSIGYQAIGTAVQQVIPDALVAPGLLVGTTDTRHYSDLAENSFRFIPMRIRQEDIARFHGTNERIAVSNYVEIIRFYVELLQNTVSQ